jgi:ankyrin repeat protein
MLIQAGANVQAPIWHSNLCHYAAQNTDAGVLRLLTEARVPVDKPDRSGRRPIDYAAENKNEQIMSCLLTAGCSVVSEYCVLTATSNSNHKVLAMVIAAGRISVCDYGGCAPIHYAALNPNVAVVRLLLDAGVDVNVVDSDGENPLFKACEKNPNMEVFDALLAAGVEWREDANKRTICHAVAKNSNAAIVQRVIERGVDVNALDSFQQTPVMIAAEFSTAAVVSLLLQAGADVQTTDWLCDMACGNKNAGVMRLLIAAGSPFNVHTLAEAIKASNVDGAGSHRCWDERRARSQCEPAFVV